MVKWLSLLAALAACGSDSDSDDGVVNQGPPTTVHLTTVTAPALVAVKDGTAASWVPATQVSTAAYDAVVHGPYLVTVVCQISDPASDPSPLWLTRQFARVPEDSTDLAVKCGPQATGPARYRVHGHVAQASRVLIGDVADSIPADSDFSLSVAAGTYDLYAFTDDAIAVRHGIAVASDTEVSPAIDLGTEGDALVDTDLLATNKPSPAATVEVAFASAPGSFTAGFVDELTFPASAKVAPASIVGSREAQRVTLTTRDRSIARPFVAGDSPIFQLPDLLVVDWSGDRSRARWDALDDGEAIELWVSSGSFAQPAAHQLEMTAGFRAVTDATSAEIDLDIPGFQSSWLTDPSASIYRGLKATRTADGVTSTRQATSLH